VKLSFGLRLESQTKSLVSDFSLRPPKFGLRPNLISAVRFQTNRLQWVTLSFAETKV